LWLNRRYARSAEVHQLSDRIAPVFVDEFSTRLLDARSRVAHHLGDEEDWLSWGLNLLADVARKLRGWMALVVTAVRSPCPR